MARFLPQIWKALRPPNRKLRAFQEEASNPAEQNAHPLLHFGQRPTYCPGT